MRRFSTILSTIGVVTLLLACSKPHDAVIPSDITTWEKDLAPAIKKLPEDERAKLAAYLMRAKMGEVFGGKGIQPGTTVGQAVAEQTKWLDEQTAKRAQEEALKKKLETERAAALELLNKAVTVTLLQKRQLPRDFDLRRISDYQQFTIGIQNNTDKEIAGVAGEIQFVDVFDKEVGSVGFRITEDIAAGKAVTWTGGRDYNQFIDEHKAVWNLSDGKYQTRFVPEAVVFKDGSKLGVAAN